MNAEGLSTAEYANFREPESGAVVVPVVREPSASATREIEQPNLDQLENGKDIPKELEDFSEAIANIAMKIKPMGAKALDRVYKFMGDERDRDLRALDNKISEMKLGQEDDTLWLHELYRELEVGVRAETDIQNDIATYQSRVERRQRIIDTLYNRRLDHQIKKYEEGKNNE